MDITEIFRLWRFLGRPAALILLGCIALWITPDLSALSQPLGTMLGPLRFAAGVGFSSVVLIGLVWMGWNCYRLVRWESGEMDGDCLSCAGVMMKKTGRYGDYRQCPFCGDKREQWY